MEGRPDFGGRWPSGEAGGKKKKAHNEHPHLKRAVEFACHSMQVVVAFVGGGAAGVCAVAVD